MCYMQGYNDSEAIECQWWELIDLDSVSCVPFLSPVFAGLTLEIILIIKNYVLFPLYCDISKCRFRPI